MKKSDGFQVFWACFLGALTGVSLALAVLPVWLCWIGIIVGGLVGYLAFRFGDVLEAIKSITPTHLLAVGTWLTTLVTSAIPAVTIGLLIPARMWSADTNTMGWWIVAAIATIFLAIFGAIAVFFFSCIIADEARNNNDDRKRLAILEILRQCNPVSVYLYYLPVVWIGKILIGRYLCRFILYFPEIVRSVAGWFMKLYVLIHCRERLLCMTDTAFVVAIVCVLRLVKHTPPLWTIPLFALAAALLGILDYELMSKRVLHLVPVKT